MKHDVHNEPGIWHLERKLLRAEAHRRVILLGALAAVMAAPAAAQARHVNPGGVHQYHAPHATLNAE